MTLYDFLSGAVTLGFLLCGLHFLRFWKRSRDSLFLAFAFAFWLLGLNQALLALANIPVEERSWVYSAPPGRLRPDHHCHRRQEPQGGTGLSRSAEVARMR